MLVEFSVTHRADASSQTWGELLYVMLVALGVAADVAGKGGLGGGPILVARASLSADYCRDQCDTGAAVHAALRPARGLRAPLSDRRAAGLPAARRARGRRVAVAGGQRGYSPSQRASRCCSSRGCRCAMSISRPCRRKKIGARRTGISPSTRASVMASLSIRAICATTYDYYAMQFPALRNLPVVTPPSLAPGTDVTDRASTLSSRQHTRAGSGRGSSNRRSARRRRTRTGAFSASIRTVSRACTSGADAVRAAEIQWRSARLLRL